MKKLIFIALCFLALNCKAQDTIKTVLLRNKNAYNLSIGTVNTKSIFINSDKDIAISAPIGTISITPAQTGGLNLNAHIGIGWGCNWSQTSPLNCIDYSIYIDNDDAISHGLQNGDHYLVNVSGAYFLAVVYNP